MATKPTHTAFIVIDAKKGGDKKANWREVGVVWQHKNGNGFDLLVPKGISITGRIVCIERDKQPAE